MKHCPRAVASTLSLLAALCLASVVQAQTIDPFYASAYSFTSLGSAPGVPANYGGLVLKAGDPDTLLLGGEANGTNAKIYAVDLVRDGDKHITGFSGTATSFADADSPAGGIDGGLIYAPNGTLLYTSYPDNHIGQIKPGSTGPDKLLSMSSLGINASVGSIVIVPEGLGGAGRLKILSYNSGDWYDAELVPDANGTYDITGITQKVNVGGGPEGVVYVPEGSPLFTNPSVLVAEYSLGRISSYEVDANGDAMLATRRDFMTGLGGAEGAMIDPETGDFLFSTFGGGNQVISVRGFAPVPGPNALFTAFVGIIPGGISLLRRRRKSSRA
jgi:hypothetical protein